MSSEKKCSEMDLEKDEQQQQQQLELSLGNYIRWEKVAANRDYIEALSRQLQQPQQQAQEANRRAELRRLIGQRLCFGTAGIRGRMGPGFGQMNELVVIQTSQGLASYLVCTFGARECAERGIVIGHDARHKSAQFARLAAVAMLQKRIRVRFSERIVPTPVVAFAVRKCNCLAGIVVTASHNPKQDNGYKVYWSNGAQILAPHDANIQSHILEQLEPWPKAWLSFERADFESWRLEMSNDEFGALQFNELFSCAHKQIVEDYFAFVRRAILQPAGVDPKGFGIAYSAMHGVGHDFLTRALRLAGFERLFAVEQQRQPDPEFPTLAFPNPEEAGALELAFECARATGSQLILAVDPDADRCAAALYEPARDKRRTLTGNELGALLGWWLLDSARRGQQLAPASETTAAAAAAASQRLYMLSTAVSSRFLRSMAQIEAFNFVQTLTGFKHMGNEAARIMASDARNCVLFAYEEAIGYMVSSELLDKDGITAAVQLAQCADYLRRVERRSLADQLDWLHAKYGYHYSLNSYYLCDEPQRIAQIFKRLHERILNAAQAANLHQLSFGEFSVTRVRDLNLAYDSAQSDFKPELPTSSSSYMTTLFAGDEIEFTVRTSGTEPKIKYYSEIIVQLPSAANGQLEAVREAKRAARCKLERFVSGALESCLEPARNNLVAAEVAARQQ